jgi:hypothetical protein
MWVRSKKAAWNIIEKTDITTTALEKLRKAEAHEVWLFILNISKVSRDKGKRWLDGIPESEMAQVLYQLDLKSFVLTLDRIRHFSQAYFQRLVEVIDSAVVCDKVQTEDNVAELKFGLYKLGQLLQGRVNVRKTSMADFVGEWTTKLTFYYENRRVTRFLPGRRLGIPYASSRKQEHRNQEWLINHRRADCRVVLDDGAAAALEKKFSVFPVGVSDVEGTFQTEDIVEIADARGRSLGVGVSNFTSEELSIIKGLRTEAIIEKTTIVPNRAFDNDRIALIKSVGASPTEVTIQY